MRILLFSMILLLTACHDRYRVDLCASFINVDKIGFGTELRDRGVVIGHVTKLQLRDHDVIVGFKLEKGFTVSPGSVFVISYPLFGISRVELHRSGQPGNATIKDTLRGFSHEEDLFHTLLYDTSSKIRSDSFGPPNDSTIHLELHLK